MVAVERQLEIGLEWQVRTTVTRLSGATKALSLQIPLLPGESVLTANVDVNDGAVEVAIPAGQASIDWASKLPVGGDIRLAASPTPRWVERWSLVSSPVWNFSRQGLKSVSLLPTCD